MPDLAPGGLEQPPPTVEELIAGWAGDIDGLIRAVRAAKEAAIDDSDFELAAKLRDLEKGLLYVQGVPLDALIKHQVS